MDLADFFDRFWPKPPIPAAKSANDEPGTQPPSSEELQQALESMATGTGSCAGPLVCSNVYLLRMRSTAGVVLTTAMTQAEVVQKFELCPGHELSLQSSEPDAFCWGTLEPRDDPRPSWARPQILFRFCDEDPAATESPYDVDVSYDKRRDIGNDILAEMQHHFAFQQLVALYVVIVYDRTVLCVSRWDRSGVVVTKGVDFVAQPHLLAEVFQRLSAATDEQLGLDLTASAVLPGSTDYVLMDRLAEPCAEDSEAFEGTVLEVDPAHPASPPTPTFKVFRGLFARVLQHSAGSDSPARRASAPQITNSRWRLSVPTDDDEARDFLVGQPFQCGDDSNVDWQNTRSYVVFDCTAQRFVFLKDAWRGRGRGDNVESEGDILAMLNAAGVPHVPTVVCHADLQKTVTSRYPGYAAMDAGDGAQGGGACGFEAWASCPIYISLVRDCLGNDQVYRGS
ncbi:hypothetical protein LXA43DRAFT_1104536 [Ganoderma leucocontextum]|nr:hypothetical protein LXA43DRAFT_1148905 [Ganoderma leucocontextum]KAI1782202.1 hypothetical protein LXA43DRAFT_1104536 [Ganoderma leucocontextum]